MFIQLKQHEFNSLINDDYSRIYCHINRWNAKQSNNCKKQLDLQLKLKELKDNGIQFKPNTNYCFFYRLH